MNFQTTLLGWHDFYSITGAAAASLVGLLFVGLVFVGGDYQDAFAALSGVAIFLLLTSLRNSWDLLVSVGAAIQVPANA